MTARPRHLFIALVSASCLAGPAVAAGRCKTADIEQRLASNARTLAARPDFAGVSVAFGIGDSVRWEAAFGMADEEQRVPMTPATKVRIGSVSKIVTTAVLAGMMADRRIDIDGPVSAHVPSVPRSHTPMTLRHLTSHTAGIRHYVANDRLVGPWGTWDASHVIEYKTVDASLDIFLEDQLVFQPGTGFSYSSYAWTIISAAMEKAAGRPFLDLMAADLQRLGLRETVPDLTYDLIPDRAAHYEVDAKGVLRLAPASNRSFLWAGGGYLSTPRDLVRLALTFRPGPRLDQALLQDIFTPVPIAGGKVSEHGIGWMVGFASDLEALERQPAGQTRDTLAAAFRSVPGTIWHSGGAPGGSSLLYFDPSTQTAVALTSNTGWSDDLVVAALPEFTRLVERAVSCRGG